MKSILSFIFIVAFCLNPLAANAQQAVPAKKFDLTIDNIMRGPDLVGYEPTGVRWSPDSKKVYFSWKRAGEPRNADIATYVVDADGSGLRKLSEEEAKQAPPNGDVSDDKKTTVYTDSGDIFLYNNQTGERRQITKTADIEANPRFVGDQRHISFTRQNNLYSFSLDSGLLEQLTDIRPAGGPGGGPGGPAGANNDAARRGTDSQETLKKEERELLDVVRERAEKREADEKKRKARETRKPFQLTQGQTAGNLSLTPDGRSVIVVVNESATGAKNTIVPNYVTESAYTEDIPSRSKVGDVQGRSRIAIISVENGESKWVDHGQRLPAAAPTPRAEGNSTSEAALERTAGQGQGTNRGQAGPPQPRDRDVQLSPPQWSNDGKNAVMQARSADNKDRWIMQLDLATGKAKVLATIHDDAWVGGPGGFSLGWLPDNKRVFFQWERDGFSHLYMVSIDGGTPVQLTSGTFEVSDVRLSEDKTKFYFTSSEGSFFERNLYSMSFDGGARTRLTSMPGNNQAIVSPDQAKLAILRSFANKPTELYLAPNKAGTTEAEIKQVTNSPTDEWKSYNWIAPPIVNFKARDGATVYGRLYKPANFKKGGPAVLFVHGAGYLQNVHNWWSSYYREYMFHHLLMEKGYAVLDIDYRGSAGYGRDWRTGIYRFMGGKDLTDHVDAVDYLVKEHGVDAKRVGLYGGSYGGFITLMAMFTTPDVFAAGAALRPVTDWAHYNNGYTSNILNLPQSDREAYRRSSPIYHAAGLKGALLICHGMVDVNVHYQDSVRLAQKLIELRKENWELAGYPVEDHGFEQPTSWADEYKRIFKLFETNLKAPPTTAPTPKKK
ncbi:MAG TPA: prolyl oligopeptidase family serine peptidase [Pyrinomonadaceae bacterium]|nr:S9 family peptidase [Acidobacteriota bacterium]HQZ95593.1 prolyl oligopeptidase family serine peptidase [Pyrinomonadaceae bacterium]